MWRGEAREAKVTYFTDHEPGEHFPLKGNSLAICGKSGGAGRMARMSRCGPGCGSLLPGKAINDCSYQLIRNMTGVIRYGPACNPGRSR
ncbi:hypothetical protein GCM10027074_51580 [Streptomyces deserti]